MKRFFGKNAKRVLLSTLIVLFSMLSFAATYYVSNTGNNSNSGLTEALAWQTLTKVNSTTFNSGDQILFQKGDTFYGTLTIKNSGALGNPITFGAYGTGANPVITGFTTVSDWTNLGSNIWESTASISTLSTCNMVTVNGVNTAMGRFPNANASNGGYLVIDSHSGSTQITDATLTGTPDWTGADVVIRSALYILNRATIASQSTGTLNYSPATTYEPITGWGYFIENSASTLDVQNEWYFNPSTKKIRIYSTSRPTNVKVASVGDLFTVHGNYITIQNLSFTGANNNAIYNQTGDTYNHLIVQNCAISFSGESGIKLKMLYGRILNNTITDSQDNGINFTWQVDTDSLYIKSNTITNTGLLAGMNINNSEGITLNGITVANKANAIIQYNTVTNSGYCGIKTNGSYNLIKNNYVNNFCGVIDDGGGIYTYLSSYNTITENIVINGIGAPLGTIGTSRNAEGIYLDYNTNHCEVSYNTVSNCRYGLFTNGSDLNIHHNTFYNNYTTQMLELDAPGGTDWDNNMINYNLFICKSATQLACEFDYPTAHYQSIGTVNYNYYARPVDDTNIIRVWPIEGPATNYSLTQWKALLGQDANSYKSPQSITTTYDLQFEYNSTTTDRIVTLTQPMIDIKSGSYSGNVTLQPFTSVVLMKGYSTSSLPNLYKVTGGGSYCNVGSGIAVGLSNSQIGVKYQLKLGGVNNGTAIAGSGSALSFGNKTVAGNYTVAATNVSTAATANMTGTAIVTINPLPTVTFSGGVTPVYSGSAGNVYTTEAGMSNYMWTVSAGGTITSGGASTNNTVTVTWNTAGAQSISVNYTNGSGSSPTATNFPVTVIALPTAYNVTGGGSYCIGGTGLAIGLSNSQIGVNYQLQLGGQNAGSPLSGSGSAISFGNMTVAGTYTIVATNVSTLSTANMTGSATISINPLPVVTLTSGVSTANVGSTGNVYTTQSGMSNYQWTVSAGGTITSGGGISNNTVTVTWNTAGLQNVSVNYSNINGCTASNAAGSNVTVNPLPVSYSVTGGGSYCIGGTGLAIGLSNSQTGVNYQLKLGSVNNGTAIAGSGSALSFGNKTVAGTYTVVATNVSTLATANMTGSVTISINPLPVVTLTSGVSTANVGSTGNVYTTQSGMSNYQWTVSTGGTITSGGGSSNNTVTITWNTAGLQNVSVNYSNINGCAASVAANYPVTINVLPTAYNVTGGGSYCIGGSGLAVGLSNSQTGVNYQLQLGGQNTGSPLSGSGSAITFGTMTATGIYTVVATNVSTLSTANMTGSASISVYPFPVVTLTSGVSTANVGSIGNVYTTQSGMSNYQWIVSTGGTITSGGGSSNNSVTVTWNIAGSQNVSVNYSNINGCAASVTANYPVTVNALPTAYDVTGGGSYCIGGSGLALGLSNSQTGVNYQLQLGGQNTGSPVSGGGSAITFGNITTAGTYTVVATNVSTLATANMTGSASISVNPLPVVTLTSGVSTANVGSTGNVYTTQSGMSNYQWTVSTGGTITSGGGSSDNSVTVTWNTAGSQNVSVNYSNGSGSAPTATNFPVIVNALPTAYNVTGGGSYCIGGSGLAVGLSNSQIGVNYQLQLGGQNTGSPVSGIGSAIAFGTMTVAGTYTVVATNVSTLATANMTGSAILGINPLPVVTLTSGVSTANVGSTGNVYTTQSGMSNYIWTVLAGGTITSGGGSGNNTVTVTWKTAGTQNISVNYTNGNGCSALSATNYTETVFDNLITKGGGITPTHFVTVWNGQSGLNLMNISVASAILEDLPLSANDEIAVFDGTSCVGAKKLSQTINPADNSTFLTIPASQNDGTNNGFNTNDTIIFKIWDNINQKEMLAKAVTYRNDVSTWLTTGKYSPNASSTVEIVSYTEYTQNIPLRKGNNLFSTYLIPTNPTVDVVMGALVAQNALSKVQDEAGNSYEYWGTYGGWINKIGSISKTEGYSIIVNFNCTLQVTGQMIVLPLAIPLKKEWNIISYPRTDQVNAMYMIQSLIDQKRLVKVQDQLGNSIENIRGSGWVNNIGNFIPGQAYKINVNNDVILTIQQSYPKSADVFAVVEQPVYFSSQVEGNGVNHMNINFIDLSQSGLSVGDEVAAFDGDICVGALKITSDHMNSGIASLIASYLTNSVKQDGFKEGDPIQIYVWNHLTGEKSTAMLDIVEGQMSFEKNASVLVQFRSLSTGIMNIVDRIKIDVFPNPSKGKITVRYFQIPVSGSRIDILDISGRKVTSRLITGTSEEFNLDQQPASLYLVKSILGSGEIIQKLIINK